MQFTDGNRIEGRVEIREGSDVTNSIIIGPVSIAEHCHIKNSFIGPYSSIGARNIIEGSSIEHSVILENCRICSLKLADSVIGTNTEVVRKDNHIGATQLFVGDDAKTEVFQ
jgi:glucose-1-phosphate thymidylyltransferase